MKKSSPGAASGAAVHATSAATSGEAPAAVPGAPAGTARSSWAVLRALMPFLAPWRARIAVAAFALIVAAAATLVVPLAFRQMIDAGFVAHGLTRAASGSVDIWFLALFGVALVLAFATALRYYSVSWLGERVSADLRRAVFGQVLRQDAHFFETLKAGEVLSRLNTDTTLIQTLVGTSVSLGLRNALLFVGALGMLVFTSPRLSSIIIGLLLAVVLPILVFGRRVRRLSRASQDALADSGALADETLAAIRIVQAFVREPFESARFAQSTEAAFTSAIRRTRARAWLTALVIVLVFGAIVFVLWLGARAVAAEQLSPGLLAQFVLYAVLLAGASGAIAEVYGDVQRAAGAAERLLELLDAQPSIRSPLSSTPLPVRGRGARLHLQDVHFCYPSRPREPSLDAIDFEVAPGETVALVGPSGAGKTTVFQLLLRMYDPQQGSVRLDGVDLRELDLAALRESIGLVSQESVVFSADAMENIRYGRLDASDEEVIAAARTANAHEFIERLPDGYRTFLGERGVRLSGGQRQRIGIARAVLRDPALLLLDEATSALDAQSERAVQDALERVMRGRTTLVIAHRLSTVIGADRIIVLDHGRIVDIGTHEELVARGGLYAQLAAMQFEPA